MASEMQLPEREVWRSIFIGGLIIVSVVILVLLGYMFFIRYSDLSSTGDANLPMWLGTARANVAYWLIAAFILGLYLWVGVRGTQPSGARSWLVGAIFGVLPGLLSLVVGVIANLITPTDPLGSMEQLILLLLGLLACIVAGLWGAQQAGRISAGVLAGFWCAVPLALLITLSTVVQDVLFAGTLARTVWLHDPICARHQGLSFQTCEIGDNLGGDASILVLLPLIGALLGLVGAASTIWLTRSEKRTIMPLNWRREAFTPVSFSVIMVIVFIVELAGHIW